jgi:hypothetical protein
LALAAFFKEQGGVKGLCEAIAAAVANDEQISEGKSLSEREAAVIQALELITRGEAEIVRSCRSLHVRCDELTDGARHMQRQVLIDEYPCTSGTNLEIEHCSGKRMKRMD